MSQQDSFEIPVESHETNEETNKIIKLECCYLSPIKAAIFFILSLAVVPLLIYKWYPSIRRFLLFTYCKLEQATHLVIYGPGMKRYSVNKIRRHIRNGGT